MRTGAGALAAALCGFLGACSVSDTAGEHEPHQVMESFAMSQSRAGAPSWNLKAELAVIKEKAQRARLDSPRMEFFREGKVVSRVRALHGEARLDTRDVILSSSVVLTSIEDDSVLETERLDYSTEREKLYTDLPIVLRRPESVLRGKGFEADPGLSEVRIFDQQAVVRTGAKEAL